MLIKPTSLRPVTARSHSSFLRSQNSTQKGTSELTFLAPINITAVLEPAALCFLLATHAANEHN